MCAVPCRAVPPVGTETCDGGYDSDEQGRAPRAVSRAISEQPCSRDREAPAAVALRSPFPHTGSQGSDLRVEGFEKTGNGLFCDPNKMLTVCHEIFFNLP